MIYHKKLQYTAILCYTIHSETVWVYSVLNFVADYYNLLVSLFLIYKLSLNVSNVYVSIIFICFCSNVVYCEYKVS